MLMDAGGKNTTVKSTTYDTIITFTIIHFIATSVPTPFPTPPTHPHHTNDPQTDATATHPTSASSTNSKPRHPHVLLRYLQDAIGRGTPATLRRNTSLHSLNTVLL
ncbi:hypothetical protein HDV00_008146 [Rhizophlyctis rosea]|nr:hypothetical protein HDV00_008146 [Rhizophlyctis rosea]